MLCTRWEDYNRHIVRAGVPSIAAACAVCASIMHTYQYILGLPANPAAYIFDFLTILFLFLCIYSYIYSYTYNWAIVTVKIIIALLWIFTVALCAVFSTVDKCAQIIAKHKGIFQAKVVDTEYTRYNTTALLYCAGTTGTFTAYSICDTHYPLNAGDTLVFSATAYPTRSLEKVNNLYLAKKGISAIFYLKQDAIILHTSSPPNYRTTIQNYIRHSLYTIYSKDTASLFTALYLGNRSYIHPHVQLAFKQAGVLHVLAASGLHVGIIVFGIIMLCRLLSTSKKFSIVAAAVCVCLYLFISDQPVSLLRASLMCVAGALCISLNAQKHSINILCITACIILCLYPYELYSAGFQLSFFATAGILLVYNPYNKGLTHFGKLSSPLAVTFAAQLFTMPVSVYHFQELSVISFVSNLIIIPLVSVYMVAGILTPFAVFAGIGNMFGNCITYLYSCILTCTQFFASLDGTVYVTSLAPLIIYILLLLVPLLYKRAANAILLTLLIAAVVYNNKPSTENYMHGKSHSSLFVAHISSGNAKCIVDLNNYSDFMQLVDELKTHQARKISVLLPDASFRNCAYAMMLGTQFCLSTIHINNYTPSSISKLVYMAHIDNIPVHFIENNHQLLQHPEWEKLWEMYTLMKHANVQ